MGFCSGGTLDKPSSGYRFRHRWRLAAPMGFVVMATQRRSLSTSSQWCVKEKHMKSTFRNFNDIHLHTSPIFLNGYQKSTVMVGKPPHHGSTGPQPRCFTSARFIRRFTWIPGARNFCLGGSPMVCFSDIRGSETPIFLMDIMMIYTAIVFPGNLRGILILKTWCLDAYLRYTDTCSTPLPGFDPEPWFTSFKLPKKKYWRRWSSSPNCGTWEFSSSRRFLFGKLYLLSGSKFWFEGKMWRVYRSLLIIRFTWARVSHAPPPKGKTTAFGYPLLPSYRNKMKKRFRSFRFSIYIYK